jgi:hypothetical protein
MCSYGPVWKTQNTVVVIRCADHTTPSIRKNWHYTSPTSGGRSVGIARSRTEDHGVCLVVCLFVCLFV